MQKFEFVLEQSFLLYIKLQLFVDFFSFNIKLIILSRVFLRRLDNSSRTRVFYYRIISIIKFILQ